MSTPHTVLRLWGCGDLIGGVLTLASVVSTTYLVFKHLRVAQMRGQYVYTVRILLMVPFYGIQAWAAPFMRFQELNHLLEFLRKAYECIVIFAFLQLLVFQLGGLHKLADKLPLERCRHLPPVRWFCRPDSWCPSNCFVQWTLTCVLMYVPCTVLTVVFVFAFHICAPHEKFVRSFPVVTAIATVAITVSQMLAMYGLVLFYHANAQELAPIKPVRKLLSIKLLLFFTNAQAFVMRKVVGHEQFDFLKPCIPAWTIEHAEGLLNWLLCVEMFALAMWHHCAYPVNEVNGPTAPFQFTFGPKEVNLPQEEQLIRGMRRRGRRCECGKRFLTVFNILDIWTFWRVLRRASNTSLCLDEPSVSQAETAAGAEEPRV